MHLLSTAPLCWPCSIDQNYVRPLLSNSPLSSTAQCFNNAHLFSPPQNHTIYINLLQLILLEGLFFSFLMHVLLTSPNVALSLHLCHVQIWGKLNPNSSEAMLFTSGNLFSQWKQSCGSLSDMGIKGWFTQRVFSPARSQLASHCNKVPLELYYLKSSGHTFAHIHCQCAGIILLHTNKLFSLIWK